MSHTEDEYSLELSTKKVGYLVPILKDARGNLIDGKHRVEKHPDWFSITLENIKDDLDLNLARLITNVCRRKVEPKEKTELLGNIKKLKPEWTVHDIAEALGMSEHWVLEYLPDEYKDKKMQAIRAERDVDRPSTLSQDSISTPESTKETIAKLSPCDLCGVTSSTNVRWNNKVNVCPVCLEKLQHPIQVECDRCHVSTSRPTTWHNHNLCDSCHQKALLNPESFDGYFRYLDKKPEPKVISTTETSKPLEKWSDREAKMHPLHSKMEENVLQILVAKGIRNIAQDRHFCVKETVPDFYFPDKNLAVYLDFEETHRNRQDKDEQLREWLTKYHGVKVVSLPYDAVSQKETDRLAQAILTEVSP